MWNKATDPEEAFRDKAIWWSAGIVIAAAIAIGVYYRYYASAPAPTSQPQAAAPAPAEAPVPAIQHPIPPVTEQPSQPLPPLDQSDSLVLDSLAGLIGKPAVAQFIVPHQVIRDAVVTVDNLPRKRVAAELRPVLPTAGDTAVNQQGSSTDLSEQNYARYAALMNVIQSTDPKALAAMYFRLYPLFQQAYESLGYPGKYFNDRMVQAVDSLLATPDVQSPVELVRPKVFYQFADPQLEALPAGQKVLIRMGPQNAAAIKQKLQQFRAIITAQPPQMNPPAPTAPAAPTAPQSNSPTQASPLPQGTQATPASPPP